MMITKQVETRAVLVVIGLVMIRRDQLWIFCLLLGEYLCEAGLGLGAGICGSIYGHYFSEKVRWSGADTMCWKLEPVFKECLCSKILL